MLYECIQLAGLVVAKSTLSLLVCYCVPFTIAHQVWPSHKKSYQPLRWRYAPALSALRFLACFATPKTRLDTDFCPGSLWVADKRYAWFDLTANLTFYGPGPGGKGQVGHKLWLASALMDLVNEINATNKTVSSKHVTVASFQQTLW